MDTLGFASLGRFCHLLATIFSIRLQWLEVGRKGVGRSEDKQSDTEQDQRNKGRKAMSTV